MQEYEKNLVPSTINPCQLNGVFATLYFELSFINNIDILSMKHLTKLSKNKTTDLRLNIKLKKHGL